MVSKRRAISIDVVASDFSHFSTIATMATGLSRTFDCNPYRRNRFVTAFGRDAIAPMLDRTLLRKQRHGPSETTNRRSASLTIDTSRRCSRPGSRPYLPRYLTSLGLACGAVVAATSARAQYVPGYFPIGVPGYDQELGVTVVSRLRPLYAERGVRIGDLIVRADLDQSLGYDSNVLGRSGGRGSPVVVTSPRASFNSDWGRDAFGASFSLSNRAYPATPSQNSTDWTAALGGGYTIGRHNLTLSYAHLQLHESPTSIGAPPTTTPVSFSVDDFRISYKFDLGRLEITPNAEALLWRYGNATIDGIPTSEAFRDVDQVRGGAGFRYSLAGRTALLFTMQAIRSDFVNNVVGTPSQSSTSILAMGGIDYQYDGVWRYQALVGVEARYFNSDRFKNRVAPIARAAVIWTPTGLTTVTATVLRTIEDPVEIGTSGFTYTTGALRVDHEYLRNVLLNARTGIERITYLQNGGAQTGVFAGAGVTWLLNRHLRLSAQYTYTTESNLGGQSAGEVQSSSAFFTPGSSQNVFLLTMHVGL